MPVSKGECCMWTVENAIRLTFSDAYIDDKAIYVSHNGYNGLFKIDRGNYKAEFVKYFENEEIGKPLLHSRMQNGERICFFSHIGQMGYQDMI